MELDFSDAAQFGGNVDNFTSAGNVSITIEDPNAGDYNESTTRTVPLQDSFTEDGDTIALDFQNKENVSDQATLYVNFTDPVIQNPSVDDTYEVQFRSYTDAGTSGDFKAQNASYTITGADGGGGGDDQQTDDDFAGGTTVWKGQFLDFVAKPSQCNAPRDSYALYYYTPNETQEGYGSLVTEFSLNSSNGAQIPTKNVADDERVVITAVNNNSGQREIVDVGQELNASEGEQTSACFSSNNTGDSTVGEDDWVRVVPQTFNASFAEDQIAADQNATLQLDSNRNGYDVYIDSDDLSQSELANMIEGATDDNIGPRAPSDGAVRVNGVSNLEDLNVDFGGKATGNYSFDLTPTDTLPSDTADIEVTEAAAGNGQFDSDTGAFSVKRGDIQSDQGHEDATISVNNAGGVDNIVIRIGDKTANNYETVVVAQPNDDGRVDIRMNTFLAGRLNASNESRAFRAVNGEIISVQRKSDDPITGVLDEGQYELALENTDGVQFDAGVLNIRQSKYKDIKQMRHPDAPLGALSDKSDLSNNSDLTETRLIAMADRDRSDERDILVHKIEISGIYGALEAIAGGSLDTASGNQVLADAQEAKNNGAADEAVLSANLTQINFRQNREPKEAFYNNPNQTDQFRFVIDEDNESLYLVTDVRDLELTRETGDDVEDTQINTGDDFEMSFDVGPGFENAYKGGIDTYVPSDGTTTQFDVEDREAEFSAGSDQVQVNPKDNQEIAGVTNVAPGTRVTIQVDTRLSERRANDTDTGEQTQIFQRRTAVVQEGEDARSNTFSNATFDFSDAEVGRMFAVTSPGNGFEDDARKQGVVVKGKTAQVALSDVTVGPDTDEVASITVDEVFVPQGGFVTIHDGTLADGAVFDSVRGTSAPLEAGNHTNVEVTLDDPYTEDGTAIAMPHKDTNDNDEYDFVTSEGAEDGPYTAGEEDNIVTASASVTFETPTPTATETPTETATATETTEDQPGFGAALALIALIGAALLAARRRDF